MTEARILTTMTRTVIGTTMTITMTTSKIVIVDDTDHSGNANNRLE